MSRHTAENKELARIVGFDVREDTDQPGWFIWVQTNSNGAIVGGCDMSFESEDDAWDEVIQDVVGETMANFNLSDDQWDAMDVAAQQNLVREAWVDSV